MRILIWMFLSLPLVGFCQKTGLSIQEGLSWKKILKKAQTEHKNIFVDCYATWCGPCKYMNEKIFPAGEVGQMMNEKYISIEVQMDSTKKDSPDVKSWYTQATWFKKTYKIDAYPTFLFFSPNGRPIHKFVGSSEKVKEFLEKVKDVDSVDKQYFTLVDHYKEHLGDSAFLVHALVAALKANDNPNAALIGDAYVDCLKNPFIKTNLKLIAAAPLSTSSKGFKIFYTHPAEIDTALGINTADDFIVNIVRREEVGPLLVKGAPSVDWDELSNKLRIKYPRQAERVITESKLVYYAGRQMWNEYGRSLVQLINYTPQMDAYNLNEAAWSIFLKCSEPEVLQQALSWSQRTITNRNDVINANYVDTYANLLYKASHIDEAIIWEQKAYSLASAQQNMSQSENFSKTILRMKNGEKIWESPL